MPWHIKLKVKHNCQGHLRENLECLACFWIVLAVTQSPSVFFFFLCLWMLWFDVSLLWNLMAFDTGWVIQFAVLKRSNRKRNPTKSAWQPPSRLQLLWRNLWLRQFCFFPLEELSWINLCDNVVIKEACGMCYSCRCFWHYVWTWTFEGDTSRVCDVMDTVFCCISDMVDVIHNVFCQIPACVAAPSSARWSFSCRSNSCFPSFVMFPQHIIN